VDVAPARPSKICAYGPGLETGIVGHPATFTVETNGETGALGFSIEGPSQAKIDCHDNGDGSAHISYYPFTPGEYAVHILCDDEDIQNSPWMANIKPATTEFDPSKVTAHGPGIEKHSLVANEPLEFTVDTRAAGVAPLGVTVTDADQHPVDVTVKDNKDGTYLCRYVPKKQVKHVVVVTYGGVVIPNFPVRVSAPEVSDPSKVRVHGPAIERPVTALEPTYFIVDCSSAGPGDVAISLVDHRGLDVPVTTTDNKNNSFKVAFEPARAGTYQASIYFADQELPRSPYQVKVERGLRSHDASKVRVYGNGVEPTGVLASLPVSFTVDTTQAGDADVEIIIEDPTGNCIRPEVIDNGMGIYSVTYTPEDVGCYTIPVKFGGDQVPASPFRVGVAEVGDASKVKFVDAVSTMIPVGEECIINLDTSEAGQGRITCRIGSNAESDVDIDIIDNGDGTISVMYTPRQPGAYTLEIKFGGKTIPNGTFTQQAEEAIVPRRAGAVNAARPRSGPGEESDVHPVDFTLPVGPDFGLAEAEITMPSGRKHKPKLIDNKNGTVDIIFTPSEIGLHQMDVTYDGVPIDGSPFQFYVDEPGPGRVTAYGPGLSHGLVGTDCPFTIVTKDAGDGGLAIAIEGPSKAELTCTDNGDGTCSASYLPTEPGKYMVIVKFADEHIAGSPFTAKISPAVPRKPLAVGSSNEVALNVDETDLSCLKASIRAPSGKEEPCTLQKLDNGQTGIIFSPSEVGEHLVNVLKDGKHIPNSPFKLLVETGNAAKVRAYGKGLSEGTVNEINEFSVDVKDAGFGGLSLSVEGPSKADIEFGENPDGTCLIRYKPTEPGNYVINIKFADEHITGSPFLVKVSEGGAGRLTEQILRHRDAADVTEVGSECELSLKIPNTVLRDMEASVTSPSGVTEPCQVTDLGNGQYGIKFVPKELGVHTVSVKHRGMHIPGSPFQFTVGPITDLGAHKVRAIGPGLERAEVNVPGHFNIYTHEAGAGALSIAMEGPSKADISCEDREDGTCEVEYLCTEPGDYAVTIKFNDQQIPDSPFKVFVAPCSKDATTLSLHDLQDQVCEINKPAVFSVNLGKNRGPLDARVVSPSGAEREAIVQEIDEEHCTIRFVPHENGVHQIHVRQNGVPIPGSPFRVLVGKQDADAAKVRAYGDGLSKGHTGEVAKFIVDTTNAGSGALAVTVDGPSKAHLECREVPEGHEFAYTPTAPGDYLVIIKYAGNVHIPGSPFKAHVTGTGRSSGLNEQSQVVVETITKSSTTQTFAAAQPMHDSGASKVKSKGAGLQKATVDQEATFAVDASDAGHNMLLVGVIGPRVPCEEVSVRHLGAGQFTVVYRPSELGKHVLVVKWGDQHIPGSPFHIMVS
jgi:filamin